MMENLKGTSESGFIEQRTKVKGADIYRKGESRERIGLYRVERKWNSED